MKSKKAKSRALLFILFISFFMVGSNDRLISQDLTNTFSTPRDFSSNKGSKNFMLINSRDGQPLSDYKIDILDKTTNGLVSSAKSNPSGEVMIEGLENGKEYIIKASFMDEKGKFIDIKEKKPYIHESTSNTSLVETYIERNANHFDVPIVMQYPELPNGCEIVALTSVLNYYGMDVSKTKMADKYLPKIPFYTQNGKRVGPNPHIAYAGNPRDLRDGWYVFATPIVDAANDAIAAKKMDLKAENVSGSTREEILSFIDRNIPVIVWVTLDFSPPNKDGGWYIKGTNEFHSSITNLHAVVLNGWEEGKVHIMNPLKGKIIVSEEVFFDSYEALGSQAVIVKK